jgi:hypothetical protein
MATLHGPLRSTPRMRRALTTLAAAVVGFVVGGMISAAIVGDDGPGIEPEHLAVALPVSGIAAVTGGVIAARRDAGRAIKKNRATTPSTPGEGTTVSNPQRRVRDIGPLSTVARVLLGVFLLGVAVHDGAGPVDIVIGVVAANAVVFVALALRGANAPPLRFTGPAGHLINIGLIFGFYAVNPEAAHLFYGSAMLLAAARGYGACEMFAVWNWVRRRDDQFGCPVFLPVDVIERHLTGRPSAC